MNQPASMGSCLLCGGSFSRAAMTRHLKTCDQPEPSEQPLNKSFHLFVEGRYSPVYWLHLAAGAEASLSDVDFLLRGIWLECCGHLSAFTIQGERYYSGGEDELEGSGMETSLGGILKPGMVFYHQYDFGSTTSLKLKVLGMREGSPDQHEVDLIAQNDAPHIVCHQCGNHQATKICMQCQSSGRGWLCEACTATHKCGRDVYLPVANSPRAGVCGYS
jgi:hypothetical protein